MPILLLADDWNRIQSIRHPWPDAQNCTHELLRKCLNTARDLKWQLVLRHSFATHLLESGYDIRTVHELLGRSHVNTTMICAHVLNRGGKAVLSPLDRS